MAILAGLGAEALVTAPRPRALARRIGRLALAATAGIVPLVLVLIWAQAQPNADDFQNFASQYLLLVLFLAGSALVVSWPERAGPLALRAAALVVVLADLLFGSYPVTDTSRNPRRPPAPRARVGRDDQPDRRAAAALPGRPHPSADDLPVRLGRRRRREHLRAPGLPRSLLSEPRGPAPAGSAQRPVRAAGRSGAPPPPAKVTGPLRVWPGALRRLPLPGEGAARQIEIHSHLVHGLEIPQGQTVATLHVLAADGTVAAIPLRAGIETAEWAVDRPGARAGHGKPAVVGPGPSRRVTKATPTGRTWTCPGIPASPSSSSRVDRGPPCWSWSVWPRSAGRHGRRRQSPSASVR